MDDVLYVAATGMYAVQQMLDGAAHNAVNSTTPGYQRHRVIVQRFENILDDAQNRSELLGVREAISFEQGELVSSSQPLSVALDGKGFFEIQDPAGGKTYLTRSGDFTLDNAGRLVTRAGYLVNSQVDAPITLNPTLGRPVINGDGAITQGGAVVGRLKVVEFSDVDRQKLKKAGETIFAAPSSVRPAAEQNTQVRHGFVEMPRFTAPMSLVQMLVANRNYEGIQRAIRAINESHENLLRAVV